MGCMITLWQLSGKNEDIPTNSIFIVASDTLIALLAGLMIFPAVFAFGMEPDGARFDFYYCARSI